MTTYKGMNAKTGRAIYDIDHLTQSISDIVLTPTMSRLMRRAYGSKLFDLIDEAGNPSNHLKIYAAISTALIRYEPRIQLNRIQINTDFNGQSLIDIEGVFIDGNQRKAINIKTPLGADA